MMKASQVGAIVEGLDYDSLGVKEKNRISANWTKKIKTFTPATIQELTEHFPLIMISDQLRAKNWEWIDISNGVPDQSEELKQYLCDDSGIYSVCTVEFDEEEGRSYFMDDNYLAVVPDRYRLL